MLTDAIEIMRFISCPSCNQKRIDTYLFEQLRHEHKPTHENLIPYDKDMVGGTVENRDGTLSSTKAESTNVHLYLTCGNCKFIIKIINKEWLRIFHSHAFGV